jgi:predicted regulator of Ras-like GTPase activity (Roadblock/LC7/MglB family)/Tfp pilus assembly protein PilF
MVDEIRRLTELLARDPSNIAFRQLAELLRQRGDLDAAYRVAIRGLERHTLDAESHALLARICLDQGELQRAFDEWDMALRLSPSHLGALKGLGFISYRWGRLDDAERYLREALVSSPTDPSLAGAVESVIKARNSLSNASLVAAAAPRTPPPVTSAAFTAGVPATTTQDAMRAEWISATAPSSPPPTVVASSAVPISRKEVSTREAEAVAESFSSVEADHSELFRPVTGESELQAMLVDPDGLVLAGRFLRRDGTDSAQEVGAELSGVSDEVGRAMRHLNLGEWKSISFESEGSVVAMARAGGSGESIVMVAAARGAPLGLVRRVLDRAQRRADKWLDGMQ